MVSFVSLCSLAEAQGKAQWPVSYRRGYRADIQTGVVLNLNGPSYVMTTSQRDFYRRRYGTLCGYIRNGEKRRAIPDTCVRRIEIQPYCRSCEPVCQRQGRRPVRLHPEFTRLYGEAFRRRGPLAGFHQCRLGQDNVQISWRHDREKQCIYRTVVQFLI